MPRHFTGPRGDSSRCSFCPGRNLPRGRSRLFPRARQRAPELSGRIRAKDGQKIADHEMKRRRDV
jgi:hypothetical protein